jgi:enoyl-CoA hydratase/carnithine racemase
MTTHPTFTHLHIEIADQIAFVELARPEKANALNHVLWFEIEKVANWVSQTPDVRVLVLSGQGKHFCSGIDFSLAMGLIQSVQKYPEGHKQEHLFHEVLKLQRAFTALENCKKPVVAAIHGGCIGGGLDLITACDMRFSSSDATFCVKEIDLAIVADIGTLQRLPRLIREGRARELTFTGRNISAQEGFEMGLINSVYENKETMMEEISNMAKQIAQKSPLAIRGIKHVMNYSRDHSVADGLEYVATWNASMLLSEDIQIAMKSIMTKTKPTFRD